MAGARVTASIRLSVQIPAQPPEVWDELAAVERHVEWMEDAERIAFRSEQHSGLGTVMEVVTRVGPFRTTDVMVVDVWEEQRRIGVTHRGLVTGRGVFTIEGAAEGTVVVWAEELRFPWYLGGAVTGAVAGPFLRRVWRRNLDRLAARLA